MSFIRMISRQYSQFSSALDFIFAFALVLFRPSYIKRTWQGADNVAEARRVAVFHHYDQYGIVHDYVLYYLSELQRLGFCIVFTSNSPKFPRTSVEKLKPFVGRILWRRNVGYDFGAFKDGVNQVPDVASLDMLLITNDSIYGPLQDLGGVISKMSPDEADIWGITDCWDQNFHLQSYFLLFHNAALAAPAFKRFWRNFPYFRLKDIVIRYGEVRLTRYFLRRGLRCKALHPYRAMVAAAAGRIEKYLGKTKPSDDPVRYGYLEMIAAHIRGGATMNQTHVFWDELLVNERCPFIKRDLLQRNPLAIPFLHHWEALMKDASTYDSTLIVKHLEQSMRNRVY